MMTTERAGTREAMLFVGGLVSSAIAVTVLLAEQYGSHVLFSDVMLVSPVAAIGGILMLSAGLGTCRLAWARSRWLGVACVVLATAGLLACLAAIAGLVWWFVLAVVDL